MKKKLCLSMIAMVSIASYSTQLQAMSSWWGGNTQDQKKKKAQKRTMAEEQKQALQSDITAALLANQPQSNDSTVQMDQKKFNFLPGVATPTQFRTTPSKEINSGYATYTPSSNYNYAVSPYASNNNEIESLKIKALEAEVRALTAENQLLQQKQSAMQDQNNDTADA